MFLSINYAFVSKKRLNYSYKACCNGVVIST